MNTLSSNPETTIIMIATAITAVIELVKLLKDKRWYDWKVVLTDKGYQVRSFNKNGRRVLAAMGPWDDRPHPLHVQNETTGHRAIKEYKLHGVGDYAPVAVDRNWKPRDPHLKEQLQLKEPPVKTTPSQLKAAFRANWLYATPVGLGILATLHCAAKLLGFP